LKAGWYHLTESEVKAIVGAVCHYETLVNPGAKEHALSETKSQEELQREFEVLTKVYKKLVDPQPIFSRVK
jgi:uncharacterized protein (DUF934 family)